jgi:endonuclease YncB( thermonuclease family)
MWNRCCNTLYSLFSSAGNKKEKTIKTSKKSIFYKKWFRNSSSSKRINDIDDKFLTLDTLKSLNINVAYLTNVSYNDTVIFIPPIEYGKVVKVYDGDTITIATKLPLENSPVYRFSVRLAGIDSPEIKAKTNIEKMLAQKSKQVLENIILDKVVKLKNISFEKYGRILADVYVEDLFVNQWMIDNKHAVVYDGGKKERPVEWDEPNEVTVSK